MGVYETIQPWAQQLVFLILAWVLFKPPKEPRKVLAGIIVGIVAVNLTLAVVTASLPSQEERCAELDAVLRYKPDTGEPYCLRTTGADA